MEDRINLIMTDLCRDVGISEKHTHALLQAIAAAPLTVGTVRFIPRVARPPESSDVVGRIEPARSEFLGTEEVLVIDETGAPARIETRDGNVDFCEVYDEDGRMEIETKAAGPISYTSKELFPGPKADDHIGTIEWRDPTTRVGPRYHERTTMTEGEFVLVERYRTLGDRLLDAWEAFRKNI